EQEVDAKLKNVAGPQGPAGTDGKDGKDGRSAWDVIPSGVTVTGVVGYDASTTGATSNDRVVMNLPGTAPVALGAGDVDFAPHADVISSDPACSGSTGNPTAPAGKLCLYLDTNVHAENF